MAIFMWKAIAKNAGSINQGSFLPQKLIGYHSNVPWAIAKQMSD